MRKKHISLYSGYTIIELTMVIITISILFFVGFAGFRNFSYNQQLNAVYGIIKADIRYAQEASISGKKPAGCSYLNGYIVRYINATTYQIFANCGSNINIAIPEKPANNFYQNYPLIVFNSSFNDVFFRVLGRGVVNSVTLNLRNTRSGETKTIFVTTGGQID